MNARSTTRIVIGLSGMWKYKVDPDGIGEAQSYYAMDHDRSAWQEMQVPNNWYLTEVGDFFGTVWFSRSFRPPSTLKNKRVVLSFGAVDYSAKVWLNGRYLGSHEGYFLPFEFDVTDTALFDQDNVLVIKDDAPRDPTEYILVETAADLSTPTSTPYKQHQARALSQVKGHLVDAMHRPGSKTKFRSDGNTGGIWQPVALLGLSDAQIKSVKIYSRMVEDDDTALVSVDLTIINSTADLLETQVKMTVGPKDSAAGEIVEHIKDVQLRPGRNLVKLVKTIEHPALWWTWDHGQPNLYRAEFILGVSEPYDVVVEIFGIKKIEQDKHGHWYLNGKRIFLRGMRYLSSLWMSEMNEQRYREDLDKMLDMNVNAIRIGSHVEQPVFYRLCDEMGILVWQVFPFHYCVSDDDELIERAVPMMRDMVAMLYNHACIGMWSVFKEPKVYTLPNKPNNYGRLCQIMYEAAMTVDPIRWVHRGDYEEGVQNVMIGCSRPGDLDLKRAQLEPNIVEFGSIAVPSLETLTTFIPEGKLWPPDWDTWEYWGLFYNRMFNYAQVDMGNGLEEFVANSQNYHAKVTKEQVEFLRQRKYNPVGSMYLYYWNDACGMIGAGLLDYYRRPYRAYEAMKAVYSPVLVSLEWNREPYIMGREKLWYPDETFVGKIWVTNDHYETLDDVMLRWKLVNTTEGHTLVGNAKTLAIKADSSDVVDEVIWDVASGTKGTFQVQMELVDAAGTVLSSNYFDFSV